MASDFWIKLYHDVLDDSKMGRLPDHLWRRTIELFLLAGEQNEGGYLPKLEDMAWRLRASEEDLEEDLLALNEVGILERRDSDWYVVNFAKRQSAMSSTERTRRWREKKRKETKEEKRAKATDAGRECNEASPDKIRIDKEKNIHTGKKK